MPILLSRLSLILRLVTYWVFNCFDCLRVTSYELTEYHDPKLTLAHRPQDFLWATYHMDWLDFRSDDVLWDEISSLCNLIQDRIHQLNVCLSYLMSLSFGITNELDAQLVSQWVNSFSCSRVIAYALMKDHNTKTHSCQRPEEYSVNDLSCALLRCLSSDDVGSTLRQNLFIDVQFDIRQGLEALNVWCNYLIGLVVIRYCV